MEVVRSVEALRAALAPWRGGPTGLVPTMGALHAGHLALVERSQAEAARTVVSVFVNPTQFAAGEDFTSYPRDEARDLALLGGAGADLVFLPGVEAMYPQGFATTVSLAGPATAGLEDRFRPTHFAGVATVVAKLFAQTGATLAVFGEKDYQQLLVVTRMARDLDLPVRIVPLATLREADGLALSSRNARLSPDERIRAAALPAALSTAAEALAAGSPADEALAEARQRMEAAGYSIDYVEVRDAATLGPPSGQALRLLAAARLGRTRLIDNVAVPTAGR